MSSVDDRTARARVRDAALDLLRSHYDQTQRPREVIRVLERVITLDPAEEREPFADYQIVRRELENFDPGLAARPEVIALSKADLPEVRDAYEPLRERFRAEGKELYLVSAATRDGIAPIIERLTTLLREQRQLDDASRSPSTSRPGSPKALLGT